MTDVENGFKVVNADNSKLNQLRRNNNTIDCGAEKVLESLDLFCEDLEDKYKYEGNVSYRNMFKALRCVIKSAYESKGVRDAIITGIIQETSSLQDSKAEVEQKETKKLSKTELDEDSVREYAAEHTLTECAEYFDCTRERIKNFVLWHKIEYVHAKAGKKPSINETALKAVASDMTVKQLAALFKTTKACMNMYLKRHGIQCKKGV